MSSNTHLTHPFLRPSDKTVPARVFEIKHKECSLPGIQRFCRRPITCGEQGASGENQSAPGVRQEPAVPHFKNQFLALLTPQDLALFAPHLRLVEMQHGQVLAEQHQHIERVYFPHNGIVSYVVEMGDGNMVETAMVGRDGVMGAIQVLDEETSPNKIMVQAAGAASVIDADDMRQAAAASASLRAMLAKHEQFFIAQVQQ